MDDQYRAYVQGRVRLCQTVLDIAPQHPEWGWTPQTRRSWQAKLRRWQRKLGEA